MLKRNKIALGALALVLVVPILLLVFVVSFDWNRAKPWLQSRASASLGRSVEIAGDLSAVWHWRRSQDGVQVWSPGFSFSGRDVHIGNPDWAAQPRFADLKALDIELRLLPLLWRHLDIPSIRLVQPSLDFEQRKDGRTSWNFAPAGPQEVGTAWTVEIGDIEFGAGDLHIADEARALELHVDITPLETPIEFGQRVEGDDPTTRREVIKRVGQAAAQRLRAAAEERAARARERGKTNKPPPYLFGWTARGTMAGAAVKGSGRFGGVLALKEPKPFPLRADFDVGGTEIALTGTVTDPTSPDAVDMRLWMSGPSLAQLYAITGVALPNTPPYATVGRLAGRFHPHRSLLRYEDFSARVGGSDLGGTLTYRSGERRPNLSGNADSSLLRFKDLGALVGADSAADKAARGDADVQPSGRVLPAEPFNVERWSATDADVHFTGKRVIRNEEQPIYDVDTRIRMDAGVLTLDPLKFGMAGGTVVASLRIDSNTRPPDGTVSLDARKLQLKRLFEKTDGLSTSLGEINGTVNLAGKGRSIAGIFGSASGTARALMTQGLVSETLMEEAGLNAANALLAKLRGDRQIRIDCAAASFNVRDGMANADLFVFDTENALIDVQGTVNLRDERVDLTLHPQTKGMRLFSLRSPLHATGTFEHVDVGVDKKSLLLRGGGAIGLAVVAAPLAALLPLVAPGGEAEKSCAPLADLAKKTAPAKH